MAKGKSVMGFVIGASIVGGLVAIIKNKKIIEQKENATKYLALFRQMNQYLITKQMDKSIKSYFEKRNYNTIAIYGMSHIGQRIIDDLRDSDIQVVYGIDRRAERLSYELNIYLPEEELPEVDAIVVTAYDFEEIAQYLKSRVNCAIVSFDEIVFSL